MVVFVQPDDFRTVLMGDRVVLTLAVKATGGLQLTVENAAVSSASFAGETYLVLTKNEEARYWAALATDVTPSQGRPVSLKGQARITRAIRAEGLKWTEDRSGFGPEQPLGYMARPGAYRAAVWVQAADGGWWRSKALTLANSPYWSHLKISGRLRWDYFLVARDPGVITQNCATSPE